MGIPTPNSVAETTVCRSYTIPRDPLFQAAFDGMITYLCNPANWEQYGEVTPEDAAHAAMEAWFNATDCETGEGTVIPAGFVMANMRNAVEDLPGWLMLDGRTVQSEDYPDLDAACPHWHGEGSITLILPDTRRAIIVDGNGFWEGGGIGAFVPDLEDGGDPDQDWPHLKIVYATLMVKT